MMLVQPKTVERRLTDLETHVAEVLRVMLNIIGNNNQANKNMDLLSKATGEIAKRLNEHSASIDVTGEACQNQSQLIEMLKDRQKYIEKELIEIRGLLVSMKGDGK